MEERRQSNGNNEERDQYLKTAPARMMPGSMQFPMLRKDGRSRKKEKKIPS
ncbi:hypothetical protein [Mesobacillus zeae]|uniref:hypothetical protein n=1 Tax=Mesobacillus zeae TaxID=1917180 RepID=UPI001FE9EE4F|nr:hypothetical protein [Mesobacillus zeae]